MAYLNRIQQAGVPKAITVVIGVVENKILEEKYTNS